MNQLQPLTPGEIVLLQSPPRETMLSLVVALALNGPVLALDANNQFDAYRVARLLRRQTADLDRVLEWVRVARAFTSYQVVALFEQLPAAAIPHVVFDLTATFYDESVAPGESRRLLGVVLAHVRRLAEVAPIVISARPPGNGQRADLLALVAQSADRRLMWETPAAAAPARLF
mgnify:FL=1